MERLTNRQYKEIRALIERNGARKKSGLFTAEGERFFKEIPEELISMVVVSEGFSKANPGIGAFVLNDDKYAALCDTKHPQGILAVIKKPVWKKEDFFANADKESLFLLLEGIRDPGNLGTIIRTAEAAGVNGIIMSSDTTDVFSPKTVRSTMGSVFRVPFLYTDDLKGEISELKKRNVTVYAAHLDGGDITGISLAPKRAFLIGNEANGLSDETAHLSDRLIKIPMKGRVESLNAAVAAAVLMFR
ncbi:MAG: RNA methyltransferase [Lachnospiraceae bacterium]|nr:RNA methyltransferase [Lachnospiraceae bacterium]